MDSKRIGEQIRKIRRQKGLTQSELGSKLGMTKQQIYQYESGLRMPSLRDTLPDICRALDVDFDVILGT